MPKIQINTIPMNETHKNKEKDTLQTVVKIFTVPPTKDF